MSSSPGQETGNSGSDWCQYQFIPGSDADPFYGFSEPCHSGGYFDSCQRTRIGFPMHPVIGIDKYADNSDDSSGSVEISTMVSVATFLIKSHQPSRCGVVWCVCACVCVCTVCVRARLLCVHACMHVCVCACTCCVHMHACMCVCVHVCQCVSV